MAGNSNIAKGGHDFYQEGSWNARCDQCYRKVKSGELRKEWDGLMVCDRCWDPRHPQELVQPIVDPVPVPWSRPDQQPTFVNPSKYLTSRSFNGMAFNFNSLD